MLHPHTAMSDNDPKFTKPGDDPAPAGAVAKPQRLKPWVATAAILATLTVTVDSPGADVTVDPGPHSVEARMGARVATMQVDAQPGSTRALALSVKEPPPVVKPPPPKRSVIPGAVLGGVAGAAVVTGAVLVAVGASKRSSVESTSNSIQGERNTCIVGALNYDPRCAQATADAQASDTLHDVGVGMLVSGAALTAATVAYFLWPAPARSGTIGLRAAPMFSMTSAGLSVSGSF
jgi:hypothetical protein